MENAMKTMTLAEVKKIGNMFYALAHATIVIGKQKEYLCTINGQKVRVVA